MGHCRTCTCTGLSPGRAAGTGRVAPLRRASSVESAMRGHGPNGLTVRDVTAALYGGVTAARVESTRRTLEAMVSEGSARRTAEPMMGGSGGSWATRYGLTIYPEP